MCTNTALTNERDARRMACMCHVVCTSMTPGELSHHGHTVEPHSTLSTPHTHSSSALPSFSLAYQPEIVSATRDQTSKAFACVISPPL